MRRMGKRKPTGPIAEIGKRLQYFRQVKVGDNQREMARRLGVEFTTYNNWERGFSIPWYEALHMCQVFPDFSLEWLYRGLPGNMHQGLLEKIGRLMAEDASPSPPPTNPPTKNLSTKIRA